MLITFLWFKKCLRTPSNFQVDFFFWLEMIYVKYTLFGTSVLIRITSSDLYSLINHYDLMSCSCHDLRCVSLSESVNDHHLCWSQSVKIHVSKVIDILYEWRISLFMFDDSVYDPFTSDCRIWSYWFYYDIDRSIIWNSVQTWKWSSYYFWVIDRRSIL